MKNGQLKPAYNIQIGVEGEYIVGVDISSERSDQLTFIPFLDRLEKNLNQKYESVTADAGYESEENYAYLESKKQEAFIKPANYEKSKTKKFKSDISKKENMYYNTDEDYYICASGKKMLLKGTKKKKQNLDMKLLLASMNVKTVMAVNIRVNVRKQKVINKYMWLKILCV